MAAATTNEISRDATYQISIFLNPILYITSIIIFKKLPSLPGFEENYDKLLGLGIDEVYCISVNDGFVMNAWADQQKLRKVKVLPDGNADFTRSMRMLVDKKHVGFGLRSWRYSAIINDGVVAKWWQEEGMNNDGSDPDPYEQTTPENCIEYLSKQ